MQDKNIKRLAGKLVAALTLLGMSISAFGQQWKDQAEFDLYTAITKEQDPKKRLTLIDQWKEKYPSTDFQTNRLEVYVVTYQQLGDAGKTIAAADELFAKDPNSLKALNAILTSIYTAKNPTAEQYASAEKAAGQVLNNGGAIFANDKKLAGVTDEQWEGLKKTIPLLARNTLGWVAWQKKDYAKAEQEFTKSLEADPNQGQISYWLGSVIAAEKDPKKQSAVLWHFARAAAQNFQGAQAYVTKIYPQLHGSAEGLDQLINQTKGQPLPPPDFHVLTKNEIEAAKLKKQQEEDAANPMVALWKSLKEALTGPEGAQYWEKSMKDAALPGGANGVTRFKGKLLSANPEVKPKELVLSILDGTTPDATLVFEQPLAGKMEPGGEISFEGVAKSYSASPFMVTFEVEKSKMSGWTGAPAAAKPKPPVRRRPVKKR